MKKIDNITKTGLYIIENNSKHNDNYHVYKWVIDVIVKDNKIYKLKDLYYYSNINEWKPSQASDYCDLEYEYFKDRIIYSVTKSELADMLFVNLI